MGIFSPVLVGDRIFFASNDRFVYTVDGQSGNAAMCQGEFLPIIKRFDMTSMIEFSCPHCNATREISPQYAGQSGPCAQCGNTITIPGDMPHVPQCQNRDSEPDAATRMLIPVGRSLWAIAAGYLGLFSLIPIIAPLAILVSIIAIISIKKNPKLHGMGRAIFGLVMGCLMSAFLLLFLFTVALQ